jgi:hypothetical protein
MTRFTFRTVGIGLVVLLLCACGHSGLAAPAKSARTATHAHAFTRPPATPCLPSARRAMARFLAVPTGRIALAASTGNNSMPQCSFRIRVARKTRVEATANVDNGPQPYFVLERAAIEAAQQFTVSRMIAAPQAVTGLGIEADWLPAETQLMATDGIRLITVSVTWRGSSQGRKRALAEALTRTYLSRPRGSASRAKGYP